MSGCSGPWYTGLMVWALAGIFMNGGGEWLTRELVETHLQLSPRIGASESPSPGMQRSRACWSGCWPSSGVDRPDHGQASCFLGSSKWVWKALLGGPPCLSPGVAEIPKSSGMVRHSDYTQLEASPICVAIWFHR